LALASTKGSGPAGFPRLVKRGLSAFCGSTLRKKPSQCVLLLHAGRSGSTILGKVLDQQRGLYWDGEILTKAKNLGGETRQAYQKLLNDKLARASWYMSRSMRSNGKVYGFELKYGELSQMQSDPTKEMDFFQDIPSKFILLKRKNGLRHLLSIEQARKNGDWHKGAPSSFQVAFDVDNILGWNKTLYDYLHDLEQRFEKSQSAIRKHGGSCLNLTFEEDILPDPNIAARKVCAFIGHKAGSFRYFPGLIRKQNYPGLRSLILNFDEVKAYLSGTEFEDLLDD
jgi:LPS sulfotransferase NodH